jgi:hypothetical protein
MEYNFVRNMEATNLDTEVHDEWYSTVGEAEIEIQFLYSDEKIIIGAHLVYFQTGCSNEEIQGNHYNSYEQASQADCYDNDISWSGYSYRDEQGRELDYSGYMEWTGH